jgi:serpin B
MGYSFQPAFLDTLALNYGAGMHVVDFEKAPEAARGIINQWVADRTEDRIKDLLPEGSVTPDARLVLTNAIYFNAAWQNPFKPENTKPLDFTKADGSKVQVPTMAGTLDVPYGEGESYAAVALPYDPGQGQVKQLEMVLVLPKVPLADFEASLDPSRLDEILGSMGPYAVTMTVPKLKIESQLNLADALTKLGMGVAFSDAADLSGINGTGGLSISAVVHKAWIDVNETGTEAAAATGVVAGVTSAPPAAEIHLDHPYVFFIRDIQTKSILFFGRVADPS